MDQREQENRSNTIRIKGVDFEEDENIQDTVISVARTMEVQLTSEDINDCFRIGGRDAPKERRPIIVKLAHRSKKVEVMRNKKKLADTRFIEEDLTRLRAKLYHTVRKDSKTGKTWTQDCKIFTIIKDRQGHEAKKIITTPDELTKIGWTEDGISHFWEEYNKE